MEVIDRDLGLGFYIEDYEYPAIWAANTIGKNADWLKVKVSYIDRHGMKDFVDSYLLTNELLEIKESFEKVMEGEITGYNGKFTDKSLKISFNDLVGDIVVTIYFQTPEKTYEVTEKMGLERVEEFYSELVEAVEDFPIRNEFD